MATDYAPLRKALLASAASKLHLGVLGAGIGAGLVASVLELGGQALPSWSIGLGLAAYAALIALDLLNPEFIRHSSRRVRVADERAELDPALLRDREIADVYAAILGSMAECKSVYERTGADLQASLEDGLRRSQELVSVAAKAAKRSDAIRRHLDGDSPQGLEKELVRLRSLADRTDDATARASFLQAADAKNKELETYRQLLGLRDRIHAQLKLIETSLDGLSAKLVKLEATDLAEAISINDAITENVQTMRSDVEILESTYEETMQELRQ